MLFFVISITHILLAGERDVPGSKDHPVLSRYPGSYIIHYSQRRFDEYFLLLGPVRSGADRDIQGAKTKRLEGKITNITYQCPKGRSTLEVYKNYELALKKAGFKILYKGTREEIRGVYGFLEKMNREYIGGWDDPDIRPWFYLSASSPDEGVFVSLFVLGGYDGPRVVLAVIEPKKMETGLVTAEAMKRQIAQMGKAVIYGIYFDFDSAEIRPESKPTINEIAKLLKENPDLKLYIVGHTDNIGSLEYNMDLSKRRAEAVVRELVNNYGIDKGRLRAFGVGPLAPATTNDTEEGRAKNRRVELVKQRVE
jgi:outer membrane protein OmpA-like peptidoglycan-associated protein